MITPEQSKQLVDERMATELAELKARASKVGPQYQRLVETIEYLNNQGGKRLRPHISMLLYEAYSGRPGKEILTAAVAQEFLHLAMLIHDDFMDHDLVRYGVKNVAGQYRDIYDSVLKETRRNHEADNMALLAGDLLQARTYRLMTQIESTPERKDAVEALMNDTVERVIGGQVLDTQATFLQADEIDPLVIAEHKTASYTFETPLLIGAILAGAPDHEQELLKKLGKELGIGYQLMDDLLGVFGDESSTGKSSDGDIREGKLTILVGHFYRIATPAQRKTFDAAFGRPTATKEEIAEIRSLLATSGAKKAVEKQLAKIVREATKLVEQLSIDSKFKIAFSQLAGRGLNRKK